MKSKHPAIVFAALALVVSGLVSCGEHERSEDLEVSSYYSIVPTGAKSTIWIDLSSGWGMPETFTIDSVEVRPEGIIELEPYAPDQDVLDFRAVGPGEVTVRVNVSYEASALGSDSTKREYGEMQLEIVDLDRFELRDPCVSEQGEQLERVRSLDGQLMLGYDIDRPPPGEGAVGGDDFNSVWVRDASGTRVPATLYFNTPGRLVAPMTMLGPGEVTVESDRYGLSHTLMLRSPEEVDDIELESRRTDFQDYRVDARLFIGGTQVCEESQPAVIGRTLTPDVCLFDTGDGVKESPHADGQAIIARASGRCRIEIISPHANEGRGLEAITEFDVIR